MHSIRQQCIFYLEYLCSENFADSQHISSIDVNIRSFKKTTKFSEQYQ